jgi:hypothetical protein
MRVEFITTKSGAGKHQVQSTALARDSQWLVWFKVFSLV